MISFFRRHKAVTVLAAIAVLGGLWYLFRPEKLFINKRVNEAAPFAADTSDQPIYTGLLKSKLHETSGRASVYRDANGTLTLQLTDFHTSNGPDVHVVLAAGGDPGLRANAPGTTLTSVEVGALKGNEGDQDYKLPSTIDLAHYNTVVIYCERFHAVFGTANLESF